MARNEKTARRFLRLSASEYAILYRILITAAPEGIISVRTTTDLLVLGEHEGDARAQAPEEVANGSPMLYETAGEAKIVLSSSEQNALQKHIGDGIKRFQAWVVRDLPAVMDRLQDLEVEGGEAD